MNSLIIRNWQSYRLRKMFYLFCFTNFSVLVLHKVTMTCEVLATLQKNVVNLEAPRMEIVLQVLEPAVLFSKCIYLIKSLSWVRYLALTKDRANNYCLKSLFARPKDWSISANILIYSTKTTVKARNKILDFFYHCAFRHIAWSFKKHKGWKIPDIRHFRLFFSVENIQVFGRNWSILPTSHCNSKIPPSR